MQCFAHDGRPAIGLCVICQKALCRGCVAVEQPRLLCTGCEARVIGFEYRSRARLGSWPLVHVCMGVDPRTLRPRIARGVIAVGNLAVGGVAVGGVALGLLSVGGVSLGLLCALGGAAIGCGLSLGGLAVGSIAVGGLAIGLVHAVGGAALGPHRTDGLRCDPETVDVVRRWLGDALLPPRCRR